jgi:hypothetical protein
MEGAKPAQKRIPFKPSNVGKSGAKIFLNAARPREGKDHIVINSEYDISAGRLIKNQAITVKRDPK